MPYPFIPPNPGTALTNLGMSWNPLAGNPTTNPYTNYLVGENGVVNSMIQDIFTNWQSYNGAPQLFPGDPQWASSYYPGGPGNTTLGGLDYSGPGYSFNQLYPMPSSGQYPNGNFSGSLYYGGMYAGPGGTNSTFGPGVGDFNGGGTGGGIDTSGGSGASGGDDGTHFAGRKLNLSV